MNDARLNVGMQIDSLQLGTDVMADLLKKIPMRACKPLPVECRTYPLHVQPNYDHPLSTDAASVNIAAHLYLSLL